MMKCVTMRVVMAVTLVGAVVTSASPNQAWAQDLADYDYENLSFRGVSFDVGQLYADKVEDTRTVGVRFDLGFLGTGFRLMPGVTYWESTLSQTEVDAFEARLGTLTTDQGGTVPPGGFDLGVIERSDIVMSLDGHYVWTVPLNLFFSAGVGVSAHFLNGSGPLIDDNFIEDLLDSVSAGFNIHAGLEYPITDRVRIFGGSKVEVLGDLNYVEIRGGLTFIWGELVQGENR
jgi:hypothetical protein